MIPKVVAVKPVGEFHLLVEFQDGSRGEIDLVDELWGPIFEPLQDPELFRQAAVDPELHTVTWPNGADLAPEFLYHLIQQSVGRRDDLAHQP